MIDYGNERHSNATKTISLYAQFLNSFWAAEILGVETAGKENVDIVYDFLHLDTHSLWNNASSRCLQLYFSLNVFTP